MRPMRSTERILKTWILAADFKTSSAAKNIRRVVLEKEDSPEDVLHDLGHGLCRVLGLTGRDGNGLGTTVCRTLSVQVSHRVR